MDDSTAVAASERPTMAQAFAEPSTAVASPATPDTTSTDTTASETPAAAIAQPESQPTAETTPTPGPIPYDRHKAVLDGAYKERDSLKQQVESLKWAQQVDPSEFQQLQSWGREYRANPGQWFERVTSELLQARPELAQQMQSQAARVLAGARQTKSVDLEPDIPVMDERGQVVAQTYSADRMRQIVAHAVQEAISKEVGPMKEDFQSRQQREQAQQAQQRLETQVNDTYDELISVLPQFKEHEKEIAKVMATIPGDPSVAARKAWHQVVGSKLSNADQVRSEQLDSLKTRAAASTVNPAGAAVTTPRKVKSFLDSSLQW